MNKRSFTLAVLAAGAVMALLGNLPILNLINCLFCIWVWLSGALAVVLYRRFQRGGAGPTAGQGAGLGAVAGVVGAVLGAGVYMLTAAVTVPIMDSLARLVGAEAEMPSSTLGGTLAGAGFFLIIDLVLYPLFGALGGLIAANMGKQPVSDPTAT